MNHTMLSKKFSVRSLTIILNVPKIVEVFVIDPCVFQGFRKLRTKCTKIRFEYNGYLIRQRWRRTNVCIFLFPSIEKCTVVLTHHSPHPHFAHYGTLLTIQHNMGICASSQATTAYDGASVGIHKSTVTQTTVNTSSEQKRSTLTASAEQIERMLDVIEHEVFPKTQKSVKEDGNKVFGAAILSKDFETTIVADTNHEMDCPLYHGEIYAIYQMSKIVPADKRGDVAAESIFVSTHVSS